MTQPINRESLNNGDQKVKKKFQWAMPDAFIIIFGIVILAALATYLIPAGSYEREVVNGINRVVPGSFHEVAAKPASLMDIFYAIPIGLKQSASIIFLIFMIGGAIAIYDKTRAIDSGINALIVKTKGNYRILIIAVGLIFGLLSSLGLAANAVIAFIPIGIALSRSMKLDAITGVAVVYLGYYAGNAVGILDPTILGTAQTLAEVPLFSGIIFRIVLFVILISVTILYIVWYANRIARAPEKSYMASLATDNPDYEDLEAEAKSEEENLKEPFTWKQKLSLFLFVAFIGLFLYGAFQYKWGVDHLSAIFIMMSIVVAAIFRINPNTYVKTFIKGAQSLVYGALVVGLARAVIVILDQGNVLDSIVQATLVPLQQTSHYWGAQMLYFFNLLFNFLVTSGTGQASIVMPIMVPILDVLDLTRQTGVLILKLGDGFTNIITPTSGVLMAVLAVGKVPWTRWVKFVFPILLIWIVIGMIAIWIATAINYGPI